ncbi:hypothetical protein JHK87_035012 [Glycine soja]|nr:hypothetical protein JHK87_035012 [Glycine soja]
MPLRRKPLPFISSYSFSAISQSKASNQRDYINLSYSSTEFEDTLGYIAKIHSQDEPYGICRIVPPACWVPPCLLQEKDLWENAKFPTCIQQIDLLQNREPTRKKIRGRKRKRRKQSKMGMGTRTAKSGSEANVASEPEEKFGFQSRPDFTLKDFWQYANVFKDSTLD